MTSHEFKKYIATHKFYFFSEKLTNGISVCAWVDLNDCHIYHSIDGKLIDWKFDSLDAFSKYFEQISKQP